MIRLPYWFKTHALLILIIALFVNLVQGFFQFGYNITIPLMQDSLGMSYTQAGALMTIGWGTRTISNLFFGTLSARFGPKIIASSNVLLAALAMVVIAFTPNYTITALAMIAMGIGTGGSISPVMGLLSSWFKTHDRGLAAGIASSGTGLAFTVPGVILPFLLVAIGTEAWRTIWFSFGFISLLVGIASFLIIYDPNKASASKKVVRNLSSSWPIEVFKNSFVWLLAYLAFWSGWATTIFAAFSGLYLANTFHISIGTISNLAIMAGIVSIGSGVLWGRISDYLGRGPAFLLTFLVQTVAFVLLWLFPSLPSFIVAYLIMGLTLRSSYVICAASAGDYVPTKFAPAAFGLMATGASLGSAISPLISGITADYTGTLQWAFSLGVFANFVSILGAIYLIKKEKTIPLAERR
ncbi:MAG TPA: hypothetical protein DEZ08_06880 [Dehalococcoidia bacterium]|nr:hypothetical protein [Dehalococcoidia bacterium]